MTEYTQMYVTIQRVPHDMECTSKHCSKILKENNRMYVMVTDEWLAEPLCKSCMDYVLNNLGVGKDD